MKINNGKNSIWLRRERSGLVCINSILFALALLSTISALVSCNNKSGSSHTIENTVYKGAHIMINWGGEKGVYKSVYLSKYDSAILLNLFGNENFSDMNLVLMRREDQWELSGNVSQPAVTDCMFVPSQFILLQKTISLNQLRYEKDDLIKGWLELVMLGKGATFREPDVKYVDRRKWDTVRVKGSFSAIVQ